MRILVALATVAGFAFSGASAFAEDSPSNSTPSGASSSPAGSGIQTNNWSGVKGTIEIKASPTEVWEAVHKERANDPDLAYSKVIQTKGNRVLIEQKWHALPVIGEATCMLVTEETPLKRIDYKLVKSDKFKDMAGSWVLNSKKSGHTTLELYSLLDTGLPYSQGIINSVLQEKINKRLLRVKTAAETITSAK